MSLELTTRGLMVFKRVGNGSPTLSQIEFVQTIVSLLSADSQNSKKLDALLAKDMQSRAEIQKDNLYRRQIAIEQLNKLHSEQL
jgi:hypothetical protein